VHALKLSIVGLVLLWFLPIAASAADLITGVNVTLAERMSVAEQNAMLIDMKAAGVRVIRSNIEDSEKGIQFALTAQTLGIRIDWIVWIGGYFPGAPTRQYRPDQFPDMWAGHPLSYADPENFRTYVSSMLSRLEAAGVTLAAFELGNEINWAAFNPDFPLPGEGRQFGLDDLHHDPEARQIAVGYIKYVKLLQVLKQVRDRSKLNRTTPILTAGMANFERPDGPLGPGKREDLVSIDATFDFLRAYGMDNLVDGYAVHVYPWSDQPGDPIADRRRNDRLAKYALAQCRPAGSPDGKPCWITEWGFFNNNTKCPIDDTDRAVLVRNMMSEFRRYADSGRLVGVFYYTWATNAWDQRLQKTDPLSVYRCGGLTESGRLAIAPPR
jgi:hypothetical protein